MPDGSTNITPYLAQALEVSPTFAGAGVDWVDALRNAGAQCYTDHGLPVRRDEYWRYTNLNSLRDERFQLASADPLIGLPPLPHPSVSGLASYRIVLVNGRVQPKLCMLDGMPDGVLITDLGGILVAAPERLEPHLGRVVSLKDMPMAALNTAFLQDGMAVFIDEEIVLDKPVHLISITAPGEGAMMVQPRHLVVMDKGAQATLIETHISAAGGSSFNNIVTELQVAENARLNHFVFQGESETSVHLSGTAVALSAGAYYESFVLQGGAAIGRSEIRAYLNGPGADCRLDGVYLATGNQLVDNTTYIEHAAPECRSHQVYKGVLGGQSRGVFQGKTHVTRGAQQTDGRQLSQALLLSPRAEINVRPELEIYADDVKCSHGATAGELDENAVFYLVSRGITRPDARRMLIEAFLSQAISEISLRPVGEGFSTHIQQWLGSHVDQSPDGDPS
ncbi:MAG: Fe-S cluster assembly protein SufD [Alphaproteobacteria bacterium]|nr:Fe-S cluster assembly protein SufD [Alphaproteobacteria bacterium]HCP01571.1 Fe-S cluster assembly protein SufD [Rhodospirillaceae bacterium]